MKISNIIRTVSRFYILIMYPKIPIGNLIVEKLKEKDLTIAWFARQVHSDESNFYKKLKNNDISKELLFQISDLLHEDFFVYYSEELTYKWENTIKNSRNLP